MGRSGGRRYYGGISLLFAGIIGVLVVVGMLRSFVFDWRSSPDSAYYYAGDSYEYESYIGDSDWQRKPIDKDLSEETAWYQDNHTGEDRWIIDVAALEDDLNYFFERTGVRPYLYINTQEKSVEVLEMTDAERYFYMEELYDELFADEAHALFVISDNGSENGRYDEHIGPQALLVMDQEAVDILYNYMDYYRSTGVDEEIVFSNSFRDAANQLMGDETTVGPEENEMPVWENDWEQIATTTQPNVFSQIKEGIGGITDKVDMESVSGETKSYIALALVLIIGAAATAAALAWRKRQDERERNR